MGNQEVKYAHIELVRDVIHLSTNIKMIVGYSDYELRKELNTKYLYFRFVIHRHA